MDTPLNWQPIATAPRDGSLVHLRHPAFGTHRCFAWHKRRKRWEGEVFGTMGIIHVWWDTKAEQPTEWAAVSA